MFLVLRSPRRSSKERVLKKQTPRSRSPTRPPLLMMASRSTSPPNNLSFNPPNLSLDARRERPTTDAPKTAARPKRSAKPLNSSRSKTANSPRKKPASPNAPPSNSSVSRPLQRRKSTRTVAASCSSVVKTYWHGGDWAVATQMTRMMRFLNAMCKFPTVACWACRG